MEASHCDPALQPRPALTTSAGRTNCVVIKIVDRETGAETIFTDVDAMIAAGWVID